MKDFICRLINNSDYCCLLTVLNYQISVNDFLSNISLKNVCGESKKVIVDVGLKTGINRYRFVEFNLDDTGKVVLSSRKYVKPSVEVELFANYYFKNHFELLNNSVFTEKDKQMIMEL